jgi:aryl-alcohol dehydrogenase-like predicted oxidoreductase
MMWGDLDEQESTGTIDRTLDPGINFIDTAPVCAFDKSAEDIGQDS